MKSQNKSNKIIIFILIIILIILIISIILYLLYKQKFLNKIDTFTNPLDNKKDNKDNIDNKDSKNPTVGFIILRHVNNEITNTYWILCYNSIRKFYPENHIIIIDDNSDLKFLTNIELYKTTIINSDYPKRGELLPYYYYLHNKLFDTAVIIHDSVFIHQPIDLNIDKYKIIWTFEHLWDQIEDETKMIKLFNDDELYEFYKNKNLWNGCFGGMSIITHDFLMHINKKYDISKLLDVVLTRHNRISFERVIGCLLQKEHKNDTLLGDIVSYCEYGISISDIDKCKHLPLVKVWTGR